jgi:hypothetical protein
MEASEEESDEPSDTLKRKGLGYSLTGITSGVVKTRQEGTSGKICGLFAKDWPEWLTVEGAFDLELGWVCVKEFTNNLSPLGTGSRVTPGEIHLLFALGTPYYQ